MIDRQKIFDEVKDILSKKDSAILKFQEGSISQKIYDKLEKFDFGEAIEISGSDDQLYGQLKRIQAKIRLAVKVPVVQSSYTVSEQTTDETAKLVPEEMQSYVPKTDGYVSRAIHGTTDVKLMQGLYANKDFALLIGDTGCGKTHLARNLAYQNKQPYMRVNMNGATTPEDLAGQWIPNPNPNSDAKYIWQDGVLTRFMRNGGVFVVDEINMAPADINSMFHSVTDDERRLVLTQKDGEVIIAHPNFWLVATMNPDYEGTKPLNLALKDRFRVIYLGYSDKVEKRLNIDDGMLDVASKLRKSEEISTPVSTRDLIKYRDDQTKYGEDVARAFFVNNFEKEQEQPVVKELLELVLDGRQKGKQNSNGTYGN